MAAILEAAIRVLVRDGYDATTTIAIAERAGVSVGSLYQYFPNKEAIVAALIEQHAAEMTTCVDAAFERAAAERDPRAVLRAVIRAAIDAHRVQPRLHKVLSEQVPRVGRLEVAMDASARITRRLEAFLARHRARLGGRDPRLAAFVVETAVEALTHRAVIDCPDDLTAGRIEAEALELVGGYLFRR